VPVPTQYDAPAALETRLYRLYRTFFDQAEKKRRWTVGQDIPWDKCSRSLHPAVADVVESFCAVELYLPDYVGNAMHVFRSSRACSWFYTNWGYEESKHSLALGDWLLRSGMRTEEQLADLEAQVFKWEWNVPHDNPVAMICYAMAQELATGLNYRNLKRQVREQDDPALAKVLGFLGVDEQAHHSFFMKMVRLFMEHDRPGTLKQLRRVLHGFAMPAIYEMADGRRRVEAIKSLGVFNDQLYFHEVYQPILTALGVTRPELRRAA
jgi:acyl-[acyl-carrier-protein] desaturase